MSLTANSKRKMRLRLSLLVLFVITLSSINLQYSTTSGSVTLKSCNHHPTGKRFRTGFGKSGNEHDSTNWMCRHPVDKLHAEQLISHEPYEVQPCPHELLPLTWVGPVGAKRALCGVHLLGKNTPLFSFGSNGNFDFEDAVRSKVPSIPVYVFDPTLDEARAQRKPGELEAALAYAQKQKYKFIEIGLAYRRGTLQMEDSRGKLLMDVEVDTLEALLRLTAQQQIGVLKIDASGEFEIFAQLQASGFHLQHRVGILNLEVHMYHPQPHKGIANCCYGTEDLSALMQYLTAEGFILVGYEGQVPRGCCAEFSFVNPAFFERL